MLAFRGPRGPVARGGDDGSVTTDRAHDLDGGLDKADAHTRDLAADAAHDPTAWFEGTTTWSR